MIGSTGWRAKLTNSSILTEKTEVGPIEGKNAILWGNIKSLEPGLLNDTQCISKISKFDYFNGYNRNSSILERLTHPTGWWLILSELLKEWVVCH